MNAIRLPISKSIANRLLILQALHSEPLMDVSGQDIPEDIRLMHDALEAIHSGASTVMLDNCGTAMRFLTAYCAQREGQTVVLDGCERMRHRPIAPLVEALRTCGAEIEYLGETGFPPLRITGRKLRKYALELDAAGSTQFISALLLIGIDVVTDSDSPYIRMTREVIARYAAGERCFMERDWSGAAFWYEYVAIHGGELFLEGLHSTDLQGDKVLVDIFCHFGVETAFEPDGIRLSPLNPLTLSPLNFHLSFKHCPDLYPAVSLTCRALGITLDACDTEALRLKESDRIQAVRDLQTCHDHRMAMALLAADLPCDDIACIDKSYPSFYEQLCQLRR